MSRRLARSGRAAFAALVAAGLTFGAGSVLASPTQATTCPYDPEVGRIGESCTTHAYCTDVCTNYYGFYSPSFCFGGCCLCAY